MSSFRTVRTLKIMAIVAIVGIAGYFGYTLLSGDQTKPQQQPQANSSSAPPERGTTPARYPIDYAIGEVDARFTITREKLRALLKGAASAWEDAAGISLFNFEETASFKVNLVYDERQQRTVDAQQTRTELQTQGKTYEGLQHDHAEATEREQELQHGYETNVAAFNTRMAAYNSQVAQWNKAGGAPREDVDKLTREKSELDKLKASLDNDESKLRKANEETNGLARQLNALSREQTATVDQFNKKYAESQPFEQGVFNGKEINVYQYNDEAQLRIALMHEFGHALGFDHVEDSTAVMYYKSGSQDRERPHLTEKDLQLVRDKFKK